MQSAAPRDIAFSDGELKELRQKVSKLERELRMNASFLERVTKSFEAKDVLAKNLAESNAKQRTYVDMLLKSCPNIIFVTNALGEIILTTDSLVKAIKLPNADYLRRKNARELFRDYLDDVNYDLFSNALIGVSAGKDTVNIELQISFSSELPQRIYTMEISAIDDPNFSNVQELTAMLFVLVDLTDMIREKQHAEAASAVKSDFLATMSHEIRTPMNAIIGMTEILSRTELEDIQRKYLNDIKTSSQSLLSIINDILDFSKIEAGKLELVESNFDLWSQLENLNTIFRIACVAKDLSLDFEVDDAVPKQVYGDEVRLRQIITNLISNAVKYTPEGKVSVHVSCAKPPKALQAVEKDGLPQDQDSTGTPVWLRLDVADTGIGIRETDLERMFKPFEQLDIRKNHEVVGTGLGLAITSDLCKLLGGTLEVTSVYKQGSTFSVILPVYVPREVTDIVGAGDIPDFVAPKAQVLVVDDLDINLAVAEAMLAAFGIESSNALSGAEALEMAQNNSYDLIFMDHMMPGMDGIETTKRLRALANSNATVPIIALTANAVSGMREMFFENQMNDFLPKPIDIQELQRVLYLWLPEHEIEMLGAKNAQ